MQNTPVLETALEFDRAVDRGRVIKGEDLGQKSDIQVHAIRFLVLHSLTNVGTWSILFPHLVRS